MIEPRPVIEIDEDNILIQLEGLEHLLPENLEKGILDFEFTQEFVNLVFENVNNILLSKDRKIEEFWEIWSDVLFSSVEHALNKVEI